MSQAILHTFATQQACNNALADELATYLSQALAAQHTCSLLLPGGSTPAGLLQKLNQQELDWPAVTLSPTDERWVAGDSEHSNAQMLAEALPQAIIIDPRLAATAQESSETWSRAMEAQVPFAATLLGMGEDGHIASLFPGMPHLIPALQLNEPPSALVGLAPNEPKVRLTLNLAMLCASRWLGLLVFGEQKKHMVDRVLANDPTTQALPIYHLLWNAPSAVHVYWAP